LEDEMGAWRQAGIDTVLSLLTPEEEQDLDLKREAQEANARGMKFASLPIPDRQVPSSESELSATLDRLDADLSAGNNVVIHCRQGIGRTGLVAACLLVTKGLSPEVAVKTLSAARGTPVPETADQRHWIDHYAAVFGMRLSWPQDDATQIAARAYPLPISSHQPAAEYAGHEVDPARWQSCLRQGDTFPLAPLMCCPAQIIIEFRAGHNLQALALTASWGGMGRTKRYIYRKSLQNIYDALSVCSQSIRRTSSIKDSWELLTTELSWTNVMTSKTLYFLCRALRFDYNPPVPIDNKVILKRVWPKFKNGVPLSERPGNWEGGFDAYCRYMTAMTEWARPRQWSTIDVQATIFKEYGENQAGNATSCAPWPPSAIATS
jgi:protein-tyrosine phosphatase